MTEAQASELLRLLVANYAATTITADTSELWLDALGELDHGLGEQAVRSLIASCRFWPTLADLNEQLADARGQIYRAERDEQRRQAARGFDLLPRGPMPDDVRQWLAEHGVRTLQPDRKQDAA